MTSVKIKVNDPCPCMSGKKYKKCCRTMVQTQEKAPDTFVKHAKFSVIVHNNFIKTCMNSLHLPPFNNDLIAPHKINAYSAVAIHPLHFLHSRNLNRSYAVTPQARALDANECVRIPLLENTDYIGLHEDELSIAAHPTLTNQFGHFIGPEPTGNVIRHHFGFYAVVYISNRDIAKGEKISFSTGDVETNRTVKHFLLQHSDFAEDFLNFRETNKRLQFLYMTNYTEQDKADMRNLVARIQEHRTNKSF